MWVLKTNNQELVGGKFSSQSKLAEFMGLHPRTLNKALKEGRNSFRFRGKEVSVRQLPQFSVHDSSGTPQKFFEKEAQLAEWFGVSRQTIYSAFKLNQSEKAFKKDGKEWIVKRIFSPEEKVPICPVPICPEEKVPICPEEEVPICPEEEVPICPEEEVPICPEEKVPKPIPAPRTRLNSDQRSQSLNRPIPAPRNLSRQPISDQRSVTLRPIPAPRTRPNQRSETLNYPIPAPRRKTLPPSEPREYWEELFEQLRKEAEDEEKIRDKNYRDLLCNIHPYIILPPTFPANNPKYVLFHADTGTDIYVNNYDGAVDYFDLANYDEFLLSREEFYDESRGSLDFCVLPQNDMNPEYWTRYIIILPCGVENPHLVSLDELF